MVGGLLHSLRWGRVGLLSTRFMGDVSGGNGCWNVRGKGGEVCWFFFSFFFCW